MPAETLAGIRAKYNCIDFRIYVGAGQWLLFDHWNDVLDLIDEFGNRTIALPLV